MEKFNFDTVQEFDNHISSSIYGYDILHNLILNVSSFFIKNGTIPVDLGCTSGKLIKEIQEKYGCQCIGYDITDSQFLPGLNLIKQDITDPEFEIPETNLIFSVFTLQFLNWNDRVALLKKVFNSLSKNGAFIVCEKEISKNGIIQEVFTFSNYQYKQNAFTPAEILSKEFDLRKIMNSVHSEDNIKLFKDSGFKTVEPFFQSLNFKGYICKK